MMFQIREVGRSIKKIFIMFTILVIPIALEAQSIALTIDNPNTKLKPMFTFEIRDQKIRNTLSMHGLKTVLFAQGAQIDDENGRALLARWDEEGHTIGNHTYSHYSLNEVDEPFYETDTLRSHELLKNYKHFRKIFRFPFLKEGNTLHKRDSFRSFLQENAYFFGSVTIDTSDWYISSRLEKKLAENPDIDVTPYKEYYLAHLWSRAQYYDKLAQELLGRSPKHTLLIHHNLLNALFLNDVIQMFQDKGWDLIDAEEAFTDPIFLITPDTVPAGESLIWAMAKATGEYDELLRYPGEDGSYEQQAMNELNL